MSVFWGGAAGPGQLVWLLADRAVAGGGLRNSWCVAALETVFSDWAGVEITGVGRSTSFARARAIE